MTPAEAWEILLAKILPLFFLLMGDVFLALSVGRLVFGVPFRGSFPLFLGLSALYLFVGIGIGIMLATLCRTQQQVVLTSFFINLPLIQLSGAIAPIESMPVVFKYLSLLDPLRPGCGDRAGNLAQRCRHRGTLAECDRTFTLCYGAVIRQHQQISQPVKLMAQD